MIKGHIHKIFFLCVEIILRTSMFQPQPKFRCSNKKNMSIPITRTNFEFPIPIGMHGYPGDDVFRTNNFSIRTANFPGKVKLLLYVHTLIFQEKKQIKNCFAYTPLIEHIGFTQEKENTIRTDICKFAGELEDIGPKSNRIFRTPKA